MSLHSTYHGRRSVRPPPPLQVQPALSRGPTWADLLGKPLELVRPVHSAFSSSLTPTNVPNFSELCVEDGAGALHLERSLRRRQRNRQSTEVDPHRRHRVQRRAGRDDVLAARAAGQSPRRGGMHGVRERKVRHMGRCAVRSSAQVHLQAGCR